MRLKVSNVCQLYDKTYPVTQTVNGVTFTNNGDGSVTVNGTAPTTKHAWIPALPHIKVNPGDKILMFSGYDIKGLKSAFVYTSQLDANGKWKADLGYPSLNGTISTCGNNTHYIDGTFRVDRGNTATNAVIKLQIFNLTEMYGAGNEPTTVAQFRRDFPNEMYEYSPVCWKKFSRLKYVTETKNLFDINKVVETVYVKRSGDGLICSSYGASIGTLGTICPSLKVGDTVTVSFKTVSEGVKSNFIQTDKHILISGEKFTVSETGLTSQFYLYNTSYEYRDIPNKTTYYELQLELGSTATPYQPYGYLPLNRGKYIANKEPVQLLDKTKFSATQTTHGVTFTNNGDGTITANGTSTKNYANYPIIVPRPAIGHKILVLPENSSKTQDHIYVWASSSNSGSSWVDDLGYGGKIITITGIGITKKNPYTNIGINLNVNKDWVMNNHIYKPQLFDLTEMYGAGNEPTTVAQFKADFPNELYDYNPYNAITFR